MANDDILLIVIAASLFGSTLGFFIEKMWIAAVLPLPLLTIPMAALTALRPHLDHSVLSSDIGGRVLRAAEPSVLLQMTVACSGAAIAANLIRRLAHAGGALERPVSTRGRISPHRRQSQEPAADTFRQRAIAAAAPRRAPSTQAPRIYEVDPGATALVKASSVATNTAEMKRQAPGAEERRRRPRRRAILGGVILFDNLSYQCRIIDIGERGARLRLADTLALPETFWLLAPKKWLAFEAQLTWRKDAEIGVRFAAARDLQFPKDTQDEALRALCLNYAPR